MKFNIIIIKKKILIKLKYQKSFIIIKNNKIIVIKIKKRKIYFKVLLNIIFKNF